MSGAIGVSRHTVANLLTPITVAVECGIDQTGSTCPEHQNAMDAVQTIVGLVEASEREFERLARLVERAEPENAALALEIEAKKGGPAAPLFRAMAARLAPPMLAKGHGKDGR